MAKSIRKGDVAASVAAAIKSLPDRFIERRENRKGVRRRGIGGRTTEDNVSVYVHKMLAANETKPPHEPRWTNTQMREAILHEFAKYPDTVRFNTDPNRDSINYYRHRYNKGKLSKKLAPSILSVRYDREGNAVHNRDVEKLLTKSDYLLALYQYDMNVVFDALKREYEVLDYSFFNLPLYESLPLD